jgi:TonB family protein
MPAELAYFLKVNIALTLFYAFYRLFFYKDTFFMLRRVILLILFGWAFLYPFMNLQEWMKGKEPISEMVYLYSAVLPEIIVRDKASAVWDWQGICTFCCAATYWVVLGFLFIRFFVRIGSIVRLTARSKKAVIHHITVRLLDKPSGPFSFFRLIFLHREIHPENELKEILAHEYTHVSQWHSADSMISEIGCMICWVNPFVWLLKREVQDNLEYLADHTVLKSGYDSKSYQYHLLGLVRQNNQAAANLYTNFNVLHLKNRIRMMNKKRTRSIGKTKYLVFLPLAAMLILFSNIDAVARITKGLYPALSAEPADRITAMPEHAQTNQKKPRTVLKVVEVMPQFPGGEHALMKFIAETVKYPTDAQNKGVQGRVICTFVVNTDGSIDDIKVVKGIDPSLDAEAVRVIGAMPKWTPGKDKGQTVAVEYAVPITYSLQKPANKTDREPQLNSIFDNSDPKNPVYNLVETMPQFPGGENALLKFLSETVKYPMDAQTKGEQGRVVCAFFINKDGQTSDYKILQSLSPSLDAEAVRVVKLMPAWEPGKKDGKPVRVRYVIPITFRLQ